MGEWKITHTLFSINGSYMAISKQGKLPQRRGFYRMYLAYIPLKFIYFLTICVNILTYLAKFININKTNESQQ